MNDDKCISSKGGIVYVNVERQHLIVGEIQILHYYLFIKSDGKCTK